MKKLPQISEAEYEVMKAVWRQSPAGTNEIVERVLPVTDWQPNTVHTLLKRLVKKVSWITGSGAGCLSIFR